MRVKGSIETIISFHGTNVFFLRGEGKIAMSFFWEGRGQLPCLLVV